MCIVDVCGKTLFPEQIHVDKFGFYRPRTVGTSGCLFCFVHPGVREVVFIWRKKGHGFPGFHVQGLNGYSGIVFICG